jgi:intracellular multiplication protein IcmK
MTLRPGEAIPVLRTFPGNTTNLTFADATGAPWPVQTVVSGNPNAIKVERAAPDGVPTNIVVVSPLQQFAFLNNLVVTLVGNPVPIIFAIETGNSGHVDFRVDVNLRGRGPNAAVEPTGIATLAPTNDSTMQAFVDGIAPQGARRMFSSRPDVEVWRLNDVMYVRTPLELLSPAATARASHVSGVKVYSLMYAPVLILTQNGQRVRVTVDDRRGGTQR